jgi:peptidoglycan lytic transglycosylase
MKLSRTCRVAVLAALTSLFAGASAPAQAGTGGSTAPGAGTSPAGYGTTGAGTGDAGTGTQPSTSDGSIAGTNGIVGTKLQFKGVANNANEGDNVSVQAQNTDGGWDEIARTETDADGAWVARWKANRTGALVVRALTGAAAGGGTGEAAEASDAPTMKVVVYQSTLASVYGVGDDGQIGTRTACGQMLRETTLGVANKTLPCGTKITLFYAGKTITVPVIDRGPYRKGYTWDLTTATADRLGFEGIGTVGSLVSGRR